MQLAWPPYNAFIGQALLRSGETLARCDLHSMSHIVDDLFKIPECAGQPLNPHLVESGAPNGRDCGALKQKRLHDGL